MYKLEVKLKQHTPLIHFQHDQEGATLRASEVKPKLDRFIIDQFYNNKKYKDLIEQLPAMGEHKKSPYKLFIQQEDDRSVTEYVIGGYIAKNKIQYYESVGKKVISPSPYFADDSEIKKENIDNIKLGLMSHKPIFLRFTYFDPTWKDLLEEAIPMFFVKNNFGSRQNKGFGCFYPLELNETQFESNLKSQFGIIYKCRLKEQKIHKIFGEINNLYKKLKSGDRNRESELRRYFNSMRPVVEWEKPAIQEKIKEISRQRLNIQSKTDTRQFVRALLGLPELYEYPKNRMKIQVKNKDEDKDKIERYQSPLQFKVFEGNIYVMAMNKESAITGKLFGFEFNNDGRNYGEMLSLETPKNFDVADFLKEVMRSQYFWTKV